MRTKRFVVTTSNRKVIRAVTKNSYILQFTSFEIFDLIRFRAKDKSLWTDWFEIVDIEHNFATQRTRVKFRSCLRG